MPSEPEVHFCNVCNQSVPESALSSGAAVRVEGRIVPLATPDAAGTRTPAGSRSATVAAALVVLAAIIGCAVYIDWRVAESEQVVRGEIAAGAVPLTRVVDQVDALDRRLQLTASAADLGPLREAVADAREMLRADVGELGQNLSARGGRIEALQDTATRLQESLVQQSARLALLQDELAAIARDLAELRARPLAAPIEVAPRGAGPTPGGGAPGEAALPPEIAHYVTQLSDPDDGTRFEAVDKLLQVEDDRIYPFLVPLAKDPDLFVRRLVLEGLAEHKHPDHVEALLTALADPDEVVRHTAYLGLKRVTGQDLEFEPGASGEARAAMQRRWQQWWERNRDTF